MFGLDAGQLIALAFLAVLGLSFLGSVLSNSTQLRNALIWIAIFGGMFMFSGQWDSISSTFMQREPTFLDNRIEVPKGADNHFRLTLRINDVPIDFLVDTGASQVVLTQEDAERVGLDPTTSPILGPPSPPTERSRQPLYVWTLSIWAACATPVYGPA